MGSCLRSEWWSPLHGSVVECYQCCNARPTSPLLCLSSAFQQPSHPWSLPSGFHSRLSTAPSDMDPGVIHVMWNSHFIVNNSVTFRACTALWPHGFHLLPDTQVTMGDPAHEQLLPFIPSPHLWQPPVCSRSLWVCLLSVFHISQITHYVAFVSDFFHLA